jgi:protein O-GlcNAc transferase
MLSWLKKNKPSTATTQIAPDVNISSDSAAHANNSLTTKSGHYVSQGDKLFEAGELEAAAACYRQAITISPGDINALCNLGMIFLQQESYKEAEHYLIQAIQSDYAPAKAFYFLGVAFHRQGQPDEAVHNFNKALKLDPDAEFIYRDLCYAHVQLGQTDAAKNVIQQGLAVNPESFDFHFLLGNLHGQDKEFDRAIAAYQKALSIQPDYAEVHSNLGNLFLAQNRLDDATICFRNALKLKPDYVSALVSLGNILKFQGNLEDAIACYQQLLAITPDLTDVHFQLGDAFHSLGNFDRAIGCYQEAIRHDPESAAAYCNLGNIFTEQFKLNEAVACYLRAIEIRPDFAEVYANLGNVHRMQEMPIDAEACYRKALQINPDFPEVLVNLGTILKDHGKLDDAIDCYHKALRIKPDFPEALVNLGTLFKDQGNLEISVDFFRKALEIRPDLAQAHNNLGLALKELGKFSEAIACYRKALEIKPDSAETLSNLGQVLKSQGKLSEAIECDRLALSYKPMDPAMHSNLLLTMQYTETLAQSEIFSEHLHFAQKFEAPLKPDWPVHHNTADAQKRLRIGYVSPDFRRHSVAYFIEPILHNHDKSKVEVFCYYNHFANDSFTDRIKSVADHWIPCINLSDQQLAERILRDGIDILVDLAGHTAQNRLPAFARKPAPIQATYIGYPATTGMSSIDYRLTDTYVDPPGMTEQFNVEHLWRLPEIYCCYRAPENSPNVIDHPPALDNDHVTFGCFNNFAKITDQAIAVWARILDKTPSSRLMLKITGIEDPQFRSEVESRFAGLGIAESRLKFIGHQRENPLDLYNQVDIALDPVPYNGCTTSFDALWMGVPFITLAGTNSLARVGVSILSNAGLPELIADSEEAYIQIASGLALNLQKLVDLRSGLRERIEQSRLMNASHLTRQLEQAYREMWQRRCSAASSSHPAFRT